MPAHIRSASGSGGWKSISSMFVRTIAGSGGWKNITQGWIRISQGVGGWRQFFSTSVTPVIEQEVQLTKSSSINANYHNSTYPVTLTGRKYHFANASVFSYRFYRSPDQVIWTPMTSETITTNPSSGSSSTVTYQLQNADFTSTTMYFKFEYTATNTTFNTTKTSSSLDSPPPFNIVSVMYLEIPAPPPGFPNINQSTIQAPSTASSGTWTGSPILYDWKWQYGPSNLTLTYQANRTITYASISGTTATITAFDHGFKNGDTVIISGVNGLYDISSATMSSVLTNLFSYNISKPTWSYSTQYFVNNYVSYSGSIYRSAIATPARTTWSFSINYSTGQYVDYNSQLYQANSATPSPRTTWNNSTNYSVGQYVNYGGQVWQSTSTLSGQTPFNGSDFWNLIDIYPGGSYWTLINIYPGGSYWELQSGTISPSGGIASGPNYYEGAYSSPVSYTISSFPATDYKTGTSLLGLTTRLNVAAYNVATFNSSANSTSRTIYGYPSFFFGAQTITGTTASIIYAEANMSVYDIDVKRQVSVAGAVVSGPNIIYATSTNHTFASSSSVIISGFTPSAFNISGATILSSTSNTFTVSNVNGATGSSTINGTATATITGYPKTNQANSSPISITGLSPGTTYTVLVTPKNADSPRVSGVQKTTSFTTPSPPGTPTITFSSVNTGGFTVSWSASGATSYAVDVKNTSSGLTIGGYPKINTTLTSDTITGLLSGTNYTVYVTGKNSSGDGPQANNNQYTNVTLSYNGNNNTGGSVPSQGEFTYNATATVQGNTGSLARTYATWAGWTLSSDGSGTVYGPGFTTTIQMNQNITLYAKWNANIPGTPSINSVSYSPASPTPSSNSLVFNGINFGSNTQSVLVEWGTTTAYSSGSTAVSTNGGSYTTPANLSANTTYYWRARGYNPFYNGYGSPATGSVFIPQAQVAPNNGSVTVSLQSGTGGRIGATYAVTSATASGTPTPTVSSYQWQRFDLASSTWFSISGATSSTYTLSYANSDVGRTLRCLVTFSNGVSPNLNTASNSISVSNATITGVTATLSLSAPFIVYRVYGYNFQSIQSKNSFGTTTPPTSTDANYTVSATSNSTIPITRQSNSGGNLFYYRLEVGAWGGLSATGAFGGYITTNVIRNNATNRTNSPVNIYGTGSA